MGALKDEKQEGMEEVVFILPCGPAASVWHAEAQQRHCHDLPHWLYGKVERVEPS